MGHFFSLLAISRPFYPSKFLLHSTHVVDFALRWRLLGSTGAIVLQSISIDIFLSCLSTSPISANRLNGLDGIKDRAEERWHTNATGKGL